MDHPQPSTVRSVCSYCGVGCGLTVEIAVDDAGRRRAVRCAGDREHPANGGRACTKGITSSDVLAASGRLTGALRRLDREDRLQPCPTDEGIAAAAAGLRRILDEHGPEAIALYVSGQLSIEAQYLATKLAKGFLRTPNLEANSRLCMASAATGYKQSLGADGPPGSYDDLDHADVIVVIGSNMADCHPILFLRVLDRVAQGARLVVVDVRRTPTADKADLFLQVAPGTDLVLLNGLLHLLAAGGHVDEAFVAEHTDGWEQMAPLLAEYPPDVVAAITGVAESDLRRAAGWIGAADNWVTCWSMGVNQSVQGTWNTNAICNLHLATGAIGRRGSGPLSLTGQPNAMGGREMGYMGLGLPGQRSALVDADRRFVEERWGVPAGTIPTVAVDGTVELFRRMAAGDVKACWIICTNPIASVANRSTVIQGLEAAELVVTQDVFADTETNAYADVVLPATMWSEHDAVMVNSERSMALAPKAVDGPEGAMADWQLIAAVATAMGFAEAFAYDSAEDVFEEIRRFTNPATGYDIRGIDYDRLRQGPVQWPCPPGGAARNPIRYRNDGVSQPLLVRADGSRPALAFPTASGRAVFWPRRHGGEVEQPDAARPFVFNTGRVAHQWHTMTKTGKVDRLNRLAPSPFVEVNPLDAERLGVAGGDPVEVTSRRGRAVLPAVVTDRVQVGACFAPIHWNDRHGEYASVNAVTDDAVDPASFQPGFKIAAVQLSRVAGATAAVRDAVTAPVRAPQLDAKQRAYLDGLVAGARAPGAAPGLPTLPPGAPFSAAETDWVEGWLAGVLSRAAAGSPATTHRSVHVLWASQTGNAEAVAERVGERLTAAGIRAVRRSMDAPHLDALQPGTDVLVVTSTYGSGEAPDNGIAFWEAVRGPSAPQLDDVRFAVLALGDSSYAAFCGHGRRLDERLRALGGEQLLPRVDCEPDHDAGVARWLEQIVDTLREPPADRDVRIGGSGGRPFRAATRHDVPTRATPALARISGNRVLSGAGSTREVREITLDTSGTELVYETGDSLGVWPTNCPDLVGEWLDVMGAGHDHHVAVDGVGDVALGAALRDHLEIARVTPGLLRFLADAGELDAPPLDDDAITAWAWGRQAVDVARAAGVDASGQEWVDALSRLQPRQYSISSSPLESPHRVRLTVSVVRYATGERPRKGVCSTFLADAPADGLVPVFVQRARHFRPPADPGAPAVMIGPGTGIAPFMGFLAERRARRDSGANWLLFGAPSRSTDHYYERELEAFRAASVLQRLDLAFSRDERTKVYVQDRLREHGAELWAWLQDGAHVYVCGDRRRMAGDVDRVLHEVVARHGAMSTDAAVAYVKELAAQRRYARDVY